MKKISLFTLLFLVSCGGGGGGTAVSTVSALQNDGTGFVYNPVKTGYQIQYTINGINATLAKDDTILVQTVGQVQTPQTWQYSTNVCDGKIYYVETSFEGLYSTTQPIPAFQAASLWEIASTSSTGVAYLGEGANRSGFVMPPEAEITYAPLVGESFDVYSTVTSPICGNDTATATQVHSRYTTVEHLLSWKSFQDVYHTRLIEFNSDDSISAVYEYFFAANIGEVGITYVYAYAASTGLWSGFQAVATSYGVTQ